MTYEDALALARALDDAGGTRAALVALMKAIAHYGRPWSLPADVRDAWDACERVVGDATVSELWAISSQVMQERGRKAIAKDARRSDRALQKSQRHTHAVGPEIVAYPVNSDG